MRLLRQKITIVVTSYQKTIQDEQYKVNTKRTDTQQSNIFLML